MKIEINNLYGIKNKVMVEFVKKAAIFAPNGVGKTSIAKGFKNFESHEIIQQDMEASLTNESLLIDKKDLKSNFKVKVIDSSLIESILENGENAIKNFIESSQEKNGISYGSIYKDYEKIINKVAELVKISKEDIFSFFEVDTVNNKLIASINDVLNNSGISLNSKECEARIEKLITEWDKLNKLIVEAEQFPKKIDLGKVFEKISKALEKNRQLDNNMMNDLNILSGIIELKRESVFRYIKNNESIGIALAHKELLDIFNSEGISKEHIDNLSSVVQINDLVNLGKKIVVKKPDSIIKKAKTEIEKKINKIISLGLVAHKIDFKKASEKLEKNENDFVKRYNEYVKEINSVLLLNKKLKWSFKIENIEHYDDLPLIRIVNSLGQEISELQNLNDYASEGQKRILALALSTINLNCDLLVFDDPISSLDNDHAQIFVEIINSLDKNILLLTHNYRLLSLLSFSPSQAKGKFELFAFDCSMIGIVKKIELKTKIDAANPAMIYSWFNEDVSKELEVGKFLLLCTVAREVIENYLFNGYQSEPGDDSCFLQIKSVLESCARHWKASKPSIGDIKNKLNTQVLKNQKLNNEFFGQKSIFNYISKSTNENVIINDYIINFDSEKTEYKNFLEYLIVKYISALKMRFLIEQKLISHFSEEHKQNWEDNKILGLGSVLSEYVDKISNCKIIQEMYQSINYLNHVNNLRWTPIIEIPFYKLIQYQNELLDLLKIA